MKKLLLATTIGLTLASCEFETTIEDYRVKGNMPVQTITHFEYKGHDYILFKTEEINASVGGVVHDPDCSCKERKEKESCAEMIR